MAQDINVLALVKGSERYVFLYDDASRAETLRVLGRYASNPELSFTWYDAAVLSQKIRQESRKRSLSKRFNIPLATDKDELLRAYWDIPERQIETSVVLGITLWGGSEPTG